MSEQLPDWIAPIALAEAGKKLQGLVDLTDMQRLLPMLHGQQEFVQVQLSFGVDKTGIRYLSGSVRGVVAVTCQRCLEEIVIPIQLSMRLGLANNLDAGDRLPKQYEPLIVGREPVRLVDIIEDELLLFLPAVPLHTEPELCKPLISHTDRRPSSARENPFAVLADLKRNNDR